MIIKLVCVLAVRSAVGTLSGGNLLDGDVFCLWSM
jgi:hypothetical protein